MKLTRKIFAFVLTVSMICSLAICGQAATFSDVPETHARYEAINELSGLGIINGYTDGTFQPDKAVTRAEMAKLIAVLFSIDEATSGAVPFSDVASDYWALNYIIAVKNLGIINGFTDGTFKPDDSVTFEQAVKMIICALNYEEAAKSYEVEGDWSSGYRTMAQSLGVSRGALMTVTDPAPRGTIAQLLFNSLDVKPAVKDSDGSYKPGDTSLKEQNSYKSLNAVQIVCIPTLNLEEGTLTIKDGYIRVKAANGTKYDMSVGSNTSWYNYIGQHVNITYEEKNNELTIKSLMPLNTTTTISLDKIKSVTAGNIEYYTNDNYTSTASVKFGTVDVVYNERPLKSAHKGEYVQLLNDAITLSNGALSFSGDVSVSVYSNNAYIVIKAYKSYLAETAIGSDKILKLTGGKNVTLDVDAYDIVRKTSLTGTGTETVSVSVPSVVTLCDSLDSSKIIGTLYIEYIPTRSTTGTPTEKTDGAKGVYKGTVKIGNETLYVTNSEAASKLQVNMSAEFYKDAKGNIVYVASVSDGDKRFGFFQSAKDNNDGSFTFTFFNPETGTTFTGKTESDTDAAYATLVNVANSGHADYGKLLWVYLSGSKIQQLKVVDGTALSDASLTAAPTVLSGDLERTTSGYKVGGTSVSNIKAYLNLKSGKTEYKTLAVEVGAKHHNAKAYEIKRTNNRTVTIVVADAYEGLLGSYGVYIIKNTDNKTSVGDNKDVIAMECYNIKDGNEASITILSSVVSSIGLKEGDVITYSKTSVTDGIDIDNASSVYVLMNVANATGASNLSGIKQQLAEADNASTHTAGFRSYKSYQAQYDHAVNNYTLSLPLWYDNSTDKIYLARTKVVEATLSNDIKTYLPGDQLPDLTAALADWNSDTVVSAFGTEVTDTAAENVKVFVYDPAVEEKLQKLEGELAEAAISGMTTMVSAKPTDAAGVTKATEDCPLIFGYFTSYSTLNAIYIIK